MPQQKAEAVMRAGGKRKPSGRGQVGGVIRQFGDDGRDRPAFERFLHREQCIERAARAQHQKTPRAQPEQVETEAVQRAGLEARDIGLDEQRLAAVLGGKARQRERKA